MNPLADVVLLTESDYLPANIEQPYVCQIHLEESLLLKALRDLGLQAIRRGWDEPDVDWAGYRALVFRSTWSYFHRYQDFGPWLDLVAAQTLLINSASLLRWNIDKHYLADLQKAGVPVVPTLFMEAGAEADLPMLMAHTSWLEAIIKPAISGSARLTFRVNARNLDEMQERLQDCLASEAMMLQPFLPAVLDEGEVSLVVIDGVCTHAVRKTPKAGDFRVQDDHGGTVHPHIVVDEERAFAEKAVAACPELPLYARVDVVRNPQGELRLMELELIEPELFLRFHTPAADSLALAIARRLNGESQDGAWARLSVN